MAQPVTRWCFADDFPERSAERAEAREAHSKADVGDTPLCLAKHEHRSLNATALQVVMRRLAEDGAEAAAEMSLRNMRDRGDSSDIQRIGVSAIHGVARPQQSPIEVLGLAAHGSARQQRIDRV